MLSKHNRVDTKTLNLIFKEGKFTVSPNLTFKFILTKNPTPPQISFIAPKSVAKLAVVRNKLRRLGYTALKKHITKFPVGIAGVFILKQYKDDISVLENEIQNIANKLN